MTGYSSVFDLKLPREYRTSLRNHNIKHALKQYTNQIDESFRDVLKSLDLIGNYQCLESKETIPYSFICDKVQHCRDNTDENECIYEECPASMFTCNNGECVDQNTEGIQVIFFTIKYLRDVKRCCQLTLGLKIILGQQNRGVKGFIFVLNEITVISFSLLLFGRIVMIYQMSFYSTHVKQTLSTHWRILRV